MLPDYSVNHVPGLYRSLSNQSKFSAAPPSEQFHIGDDTVSTGVGASATVDARWRAICEHRANARERCTGSACSYVNIVTTARLTDCVKVFGSTHP